MRRTFLNNAISSAQLTIAIDTDSPELLSSLQTAPAIIKPEQLIIFHAFIFSDTDFAATTSRRFHEKHFEPTRTCSPNPGAISQERHQHHLGRAPAD
ncbi:hypothetical protein D3C85_1347110 [compost metagenome]